MTARHEDHDPSHTRFQRDIVRMLLTFFAVVAIDVVFLSVMQHRLRFWFPVWLDPHWAERRAPWVVYSQSYFAGIFMIPVLFRIIDRDFVAPRGISTRAALWGFAGALLAFVGWWKGGLMVQHHKHVEALGWLALTSMVWILIGLAESLPRRVAMMSRRQVLGTLMVGVSMFFLVMAALDPLVQIRVQHLGWSSGLIVEVGFFVPAGIACFTVGRRMRRATSKESTDEGSDIRVRDPAPGSRQGPGLA